MNVLAIIIGIISFTLIGILWSSNMDMEEMPKMFESESIQKKKKFNTTLIRILMVVGIFFIFGAVVHGVPWIAGLIIAVVSVIVGIIIRTIVINR